MTGHDHSHSHHDHDHDDRWKHDGVRVIPGNQLDTNVPSTAGMDRAAAINFARVGAQKLWAGTVSIKPDAKTGAHHHGHLESVIYVPPYVPHQEINASPNAPLSCVVVRSDQEPVVVNLDLPDIEADPEHVQWVDDIHPPH